MAALPGDVFVPATASGLPRDSVVTVTGIVTLDEDDVTEGRPAPSHLQTEVEEDDGWEVR